jgi:type II secretory pathway pseudopilin PulG
MGRLGWGLGLVVAFIVGAAAGGLLRGVLPSASEVKRLQEMQLGLLQARLHAREAALSAAVASHAPARRGEDARVSPLAAAPAATGGDGQQPGAPPAGGPSRGGPRDEPGVAGRGAAVAAGAPATVDAALDRFYRFLDELRGAGGSGRWARTREATADLRAMGEAGVEALMRVLANGTSADERRAAANLLGELGAAQALPLLQGILSQDNDLLLRRAAASALRRLETADAVPTLQALLGNPAEDRFVRMSAAYGLARLGFEEGVAALTMIFAETTGDGRGRDVAFRSLVSLNDERALPFMRQVVNSGAEVGYRLQAIRFLAAQGDRQALAILQQIMRTPAEQPSIRDAASQAYAAISGR